MWKRVCDQGAVAPGGLKQFDLGGGPSILIVNAEGTYYAYQAYCPHEAYKLEDGVHDGSVLTCLEHMWQFDVATGAPLADAETGLETYRLKEEDGALHVWIEDAAT
jgi:toluene monooxygenase system ferredoxin subunit